MSEPFDDLKAGILGRISRSLLVHLERALLHWSKDVGAVIGAHHRDLFERLSKKEPCDMCGAEIYFLHYSNGEIVPHGLDGRPHLNSCKMARRMQGLEDDEE